MQQVISSKFELFKPRLIDSSSEKTFKREFTPLSALQHGSPIEFIVPGTDLQYLDLSSSDLLITAKIQTPANANPGNGIEVGPINLTLHSLFSNVEVELGGKSVSDSNGHYPYRAYLEFLMSYDKNYQETQGQIAGWAKDTAGQMEDFHTIDNAAVNLGLKERAARFPCNPSRLRKTAAV